MSLLNRHLHEFNILVLDFSSLLFLFYFFIIGMTTKFSKGKLAKIQEKKAKAGLTGGLLIRKCQRDSEPPKDDPMVTLPIAKSKPQCPASPASSLELITPSDSGSKAKGKGKAPTCSFWEDVGAAVLKAHEAISINKLSPLGVRLSYELMFSHVHKIM